VPEPNLETQCGGHPISPESREDDEMEWEEARKDELECRQGRGSSRRVTKSISWDSSTRDGSRGVRGPIEIGVECSSAPVSVDADGRSWQLRVEAQRKFDRDPSSSSRCSCGFTFLHLSHCTRPSPPSRDRQLRRTIVNLRQTTSNHPRTRP